MRRTSVLLAVLMVVSMPVNSAYPGTLQTQAPADTQTAPAHDVATPPAPAPTQDITTPAPAADEQAFPALEAATPYVSGPSPEQVNPAPVVDEEVSTPQVAPIPASHGSVTPSADAAGIGGSILMILVMIAGVAFFRSFRRS